ncbi:hypothetical protein EC991_005936 [Linnemannia zychae]|nr:hypothetical protein EC991_005936 [Linnemannia zychae]
MRFSWTRCLLASGVCLGSIASVAQAKLLCGSPNSGGAVFKAGDNVLLALAADGTSPTVDEVQEATATLYCNTGTVIATIKITDPKLPLPYKIPSVGNYTTPQQTTGPCSGNMFHFAYSGKTTGLFNPSFGPVPCLDISITPGPYVAPPANTTTIAPTIPVPTTPTSSKQTTTTTTTSTAPSPSDTPPEVDGGGKPKTAIIVSVAIAVVLIVTFLGVAICFRVKRQRRKRMESAIMPWSKPNNNQFSKMPSSLDEDRPSPSGGASSAAAAAAAELSGEVNNKTPPKPPQMYASSGRDNYGEDSYTGFDQQHNQRHPHGVYYEGQSGYSNPQEGYASHQGGYNNPQEGYASHQDDYYNLYYAQQTGEGGGGYQGAGAAVGYGYADRANPQDGHYASQGAHNPYLDPLDPYPASAPQTLPPGRKRTRGKVPKAGVVPAAGYYPPPPPIRGPAGIAKRGPNSMAPPTPNYGQLNTDELILPESAPLPVPSGPLRAPQGIVEPEKKTHAAETELTGIPMRPLPSHPQVLPPEKRGPAANIELTSIPMQTVASNPHT